MLGLVGGALIACLSDLDERNLTPGDRMPAGGAAGASLGGAAGISATGGTSTGGTSTGGTGMNAGSAGSSAGTTSSGGGGSGGTAGGSVNEGGMGAEAGGGPDPECGGELLACDGACVDATSDSAHCGMCDRGCPAGSACMGSECECSDGQLHCGDACVNTLTDALHCGDCGEECLLGQSCVDGECQCASGLVPCSDGCVDTNSNSAHCGTCELPCEAGEVCSTGMCADTCSSSQERCGNDCVDTQSSAAHCGACDDPCPGADICVAGECECPNAQAKCDNRCVDTSTDNLHCGQCGVDCTGGKSCLEAECRCPQGQTDCSGTCQNLMTDAVNCGTCGNACGADQTCVGGRCTCPAGQVLWGGECLEGSLGCNTQRSLQNGSNSLVSGGNTRSFVLRAPAAYDSARPYRLVVAYPPNGTTAAQLDAGGGSTPVPYYGHLALSQSDTIFVAMQSLNNGAWPNTNNGDVLFTDAVVAAVSDALCVDEDRIFATGFSAGGGMPYALACARADVYRGAVAFSGGNFSGCVGGTSPVAFYASHGVSDSTIPISSGRLMRDKFIQVNGCTAVSPEPSVPNGSHTCTTYSGCSAGHPVEWCAFSGDHIADPRDSGQGTGWNPARSWAFITQF
jgi:poly(3-hydroxybutyrate) depolymerase